MRWEGSDSCPALKDWPGGLGEESSHVEGFAVADSRGEGSSGAGGSVPDGIPSLEPDGAPVVPGSGLNLFGDYVGDWLQEPHDTVEDSHSPYVPVTLEMPEAEIVDDAEEDVRVFEGREAQAFQRAVFEQGMSRRRAAQAATGNWHIQPGPLGTSTDFWMPVPAEPLVASSSQGSGMDERVDEAGLPSKLPTFAKHVRALCDQDHSEMQDLTWMKAPGLLVGHTRRVQLLWASGRLCAEQVDGEGS